MERYYQIADIGICIKSSDELMYADERMLEPFACAPCDGAEVYTFEIVDAMPEAEGECVFSSPAMAEYCIGTERIRYIGPVERDVGQAHMRVCFTERGNLVSLASSSYTAVTPKSVLNALGMEHLAVIHDSVILHASYIVADGHGILFTAPSGTGKSTQAQIWHDARGARIINGDRAIMQVKDGGVFACPLPFSGSSQICENVTSPLSAIVYLSQAPKTTISDLTGIRAFSRIWEGCCVNAWDRADTDLAMRTVSEIVARVPVYSLACTPDISAVEALERAMQERK